MATYYVDGVNGLDTNNGLSLANAHKTLDKTLSLVIANDTIYLVPNSVYKYTNANFSSVAYTMMSYQDLKHATIDFETKSISWSTTKTFKLIEMKNVGLINTPSGAISVFYDTCIIDGGTNAINAAAWTNSSSMRYDKCIFKNLQKAVSGAYAVQFQYGTTASIDVKNSVFYNINGIASSGTINLYNCILSDSTTVGGGIKLNNAIRRSVYTQYEYVDSVLFGVYLYLNKFLISLGSEARAITYRNIASSTLIPVMTSNTAPSGVASASGTWSASFPAWQAFDAVNNSNASWVGASGYTSGWLRYEFPTAKMIGKYAVTSRNDATYRGDLKSWTFEGSNDGVNWTVLDTKINQPAWASNEERQYDIINNDSYKFYQINVSAVTLVGTNVQVSIGWLKMFEVLIPDNSLIHLNSTTEQSFITYGMNKSSTIDLQATIMDYRYFVQNQSSVLGNGKVFKKTIDTSTMPVKDAKIK